MTPSEKQKCIAEQAVYGDLLVSLLIESSKGEIYCEFESNFLDLYGKDRDNYQTRKPILRPLSNLTKEITHKGYNDDKPFVPLIKLAKINFTLRPQDNIDYTLQNGDYGYGVFFNSKPYRERARCFFLQVYKNGALQAFSTDVMSHSDKSNTAKHCGLKAKEIIDLLHLWHFDTRTLIEKGEAIDVNTLSINPYSV